MANVSINESANFIKTIKKGSKEYVVRDEEVRTAVKGIQISLDNTYQTPTKVQELVSPQTNDNFQSAIQKLNNGVVADEETWAAALNQIEDDIEDAMKLPSTYTESTETNQNLIPEALDTIYVAIAKIHKILSDLELVHAAALNNLNDRVTALES